MKKRDIATSSIGTVTGTATVIGGKAAAMGIATTFGTASTGTAIAVYQEWLQPMQQQPGWEVAH